MKFRFDDYLKLSGRQLANKRLVVFIGKSGAGKSSYIEFLLKQHSDFANRDVFRISEGRSLNWREIIPSTPSLIVIDEITNFRDLFHIARLLNANHNLLVASHLPKILHWPLRMFGTIELFQIDKVRSKVVTALKKRNVQFSDQSINNFMNQFGANYTDLEIILEASPTSNLDIALRYFNQFHTIERIRNA